MKQNKLSKVFLYLALFVVLSSVGVSAHNSTEPMTVRVLEADQNEYTFSCNVPFEVRDGDYTWAVRADDTVVYEQTNKSDTLTLTLDQDVIYHVGCFVFPTDDTDYLPESEGLIVMYDHHIDLRSGAYEDRPQIDIIEAQNKTVNALCTPHQATEYNMQWFWNRYDEHHNFGHGQDEITAQAPSYGLWELACGVWDIPREEWTQSALTLEFFPDGTVYVPTKDGCLPGEECIQTNHTGTITVQKVLVNDDEGNATIEQFTFSVGSFDVQEGETNTFPTGNYQVAENGPTNYAATFSGDCDTNGNIVLNTGENLTCTITNDDVAEDPVCGNGIVETEEQCDDNNTANGDGCSATCTIESNETACYSSFNELPVNCTGTITSDVKGSPRTIMCSADDGSVEVQAWERNDSTGNHFEMWRINSNGTEPVVCLGDDCLESGWGYERGSNYPICLENTTQPEPPGNETMCYTALQEIPATCNGGTITNDTYNGCRQIICATGESSLQVLTCPKPDVGDKEYFEMYKQSDNPTRLEICLGETCIKNNGFAQSNEFPICTGNNTQPPNQTLTQPAWIEPTQGLTGVTLDYFHLATNPPDEEVVASDWEIWNETQRIWHATNNTGTITFHTHTPDGVFEESQLEPLTTYEARVRYQYTNATGPWSEWRSFTTRDSVTLNPDSPDWTAVDGYHVEKFASGFDAPVHLAFAPDIYEHLNENQQPYFYVTELYGTVKVVYADGSSAIYADDLLNFDPFGSITGGGQMGTISLYVEPETGDVYVGTVYLDGDDVYNKIIKFTTHNDGHSFTNQETLIDELPSGPSHQIQQITRGPDGKIYVNLGEGLNPANAQDDSILAGKIIRMNPDGTGVETYAKGFRNPFGGDWRPGTNQLIVTDNAPDKDDRLVAVEEGVNYGWGMQDGLATFLAERIDTLNVSPVDVEFNPGLTSFSELYVAVAGPIYQLGPTDGKQILEYTLNEDASVSSRSVFVEYTGDGYGTPIGLDFGPDGLYFTDLYGEPGFVGIGETESNIYRVVPGEPSNETQEQDVFRTGISVIPWYPKDTGEGIEYIFECQGIDGSGNYSYEFDFGTGSFDIGGNRQYMSYFYGNANHTVSCTANDLETQESADAALVVNPSNFIAE